MPQFLFLSCGLMKTTDEFYSLPKAELILDFSQHLPIKFFNRSFADPKKYSGFNRKLLVLWTLFRTFSSSGTSHNSMHNGKTGLVIKGWFIKVIGKWSFLSEGLMLSLRHCLLLRPFKERLFLIFTWHWASNPEKEPERGDGQARNTEVGV